MKIFFPILAFLLLVINVSALNTSTSGNYTFIFTGQQIIGKTLDLTIQNTNIGLDSGFSCNEYLIKQNETVLTHTDAFTIAQIISGNTGQLKSNLFIDDRFEANGYYILTIKCLGISTNNRISESASLDIVLNIIQEPSFYFLNNWGFYAKQHNIEIILLMIIISLVASFVLVYFGLKG